MRRPRLLLLLLALLVATTHGAAALELPGEWPAVCTHKRGTLFLG